jgi:hypothetical protein
MEPTDAATKRPDYLDSAKQIARLAKKKSPRYILHMHEADEEVPEDSDFYPNSKPETDPVDGKTILKGKPKSFLPEYKGIFEEDLPSGVFHRKYLLKSRFIWSLGANQSNRQSTGYPQKN